MLKITLEIKEIKNKDNCKLIMKNPSKEQLEKSSGIEKNCLINVQNVIMQKLKELENKN